MKIHIDSLSFLLGFAIASLGWLLYHRVRTAWPKLKTLAKQWISEQRDRNLRGLENYLRQEAIERAQRQHLAARMFPLEDILVEPQLLAAPALGDPDHVDEQEPVITQVISSLPDQPLLPSLFGYPRLTLEAALQNGGAVVVIGRPGAGKTVALAHLAIQLARRQCAEPLESCVPIYFHISDLPSRPDPSADPAVVLQKVIARRMLVIYQQQVGPFLSSALTTGRAVLIVDGVDELPPRQLAEAAAWLKSLRAKYPLTRLITSGDPAYLDGLLASGFLPLALAAWRPDEAHTFARRWKEAWDRTVAPQMAAANGRSAFDSHLPENWLTNRTDRWTPLEWTAQAWGLFAGDVTGPQPSQAIEAYVRRMLRDQADFDTLTRLAAHAVKTGQAAVAMVEASLLASETAESEGPLSDEPADRPEGKPKKVVERTRPLSAGTKAIDTLVEASLLTRRPGDWITFPQPAICGYLASRSGDLDNLQEHPATGVFCWSIQSACLRYTLGQGKAVDRAGQLIAGDTAPLHENLTALCGYLSDAPPQTAWRPAVMRPIVRLLQDDYTPVAVRARLVSTLAGINDPAVAVLFRQLLCSPSADVRRLAALGAGALQDGKAIADLILRLADTDRLVQAAACFALAGLTAEDAREAVMAALEEGDEDLRRIAAESLSGSGPQGQRLLLDALASPDLLTRRAAIYGLSLVRQPWVNEALEKTAVEDGQWIIRNSAAQALESLNQPGAHLPKPLSPPSEAPWLIRFAGRLGESVPRDQSPLPLLLRALEEGSPSEQQAATQYLRRSADSRVVERLCEAAGGPSPLADSAVYALWWMHSGGARLPAAIKAR